MKNLHSIIFSLLSLLSSIAPAFSHAASPEEIYQGCVKKVSAAKSMDVRFSLSESGKSASGTLLTKGSKFAVTFPGLGTWYDGKSMWSYSAVNKETTVWTPSKTELAESNPMLYLSMAADFNAVAKAGGKGLTVVTLTPKKRSAGIKSVTLTISNSNQMPKKLVINAGGRSSTISISSVSLNTSIADSKFTYPKASYPKVPVTDLR